MNDLLTCLQKDLPARLLFLEQMVSMETPSFDKPLVDRFAAFLAERFRELDGAAELVPAANSGNHLRVRFDGGDGTRCL
jgi:hypothetical protein